MELSVAVLIAAAFFLGGLSKGIVGFGLPLIAIPTMAFALPLPVAIALTFVPVVLSNFWQAAVGGFYLDSLKRFWVFILLLMIGCTLGAQILTRVNSALVLAAVAAVLLLFVASRMMTPAKHLSPGQEFWLNPVVGFINGLLGGVAGVFALVVPYCMGLRLQRDFFVASLGMIYLLGSAPLYITLITSGNLTFDQMLVSLLGCLPLVLGLTVGRFLRSRLSAKTFETCLLFALCAVAVNLLYQAILA